MLSWMAGCSDCSPFGLFLCDHKGLISWKSNAGTDLIHPCNKGPAFGLPLFLGWWNFIPGERRSLENLVAFWQHVWKIIRLQVWTMAPVDSKRLRYEWSCSTLCPIYDAGMLCEKPLTLPSLSSTVSMFCNCNSVWRGYSLNRYWTQMSHQDYVDSRFFINDPWQTLWYQSGEESP